MQRAQGRLAGFDMPGTNDCLIVRTATRKLLINDRHHQFIAQGWRSSVIVRSVVL